LGLPDLILLPTIELAAFEEAIAFFAIHGLVGINRDIRIHPSEPPSHSTVKSTAVDLEPTAPLHRGQLGGDGKPGIRCVRALVEIQKKVERRGSCPPPSSLAGDPYSYPPGAASDCSGGSPLHPW
jgi:hypothetical protein